MRFQCVFAIGDQCSLPSPMSARQARAAFVSSEKVRRVRAEAIFLLQRSRHQPIVRGLRRRSKPDAEGASDGIAEVFRRKPNHGTRECIRLSRLDESSREAIGETTCTDQSIEALVQFALERFEINHGVQGSMNCFCFGRHVEYTSRPVNLRLVQEKVLTPDMCAFSRFLALADPPYLAHRLSSLLAT